MVRTLTTTPRSKPEQGQNLGSVVCRIPIHSACSLCLPPVFALPFSIRALCPYHPWGKLVLAGRLPTRSIFAHLKPPIPPIFFFLTARASSPLLTGTGGAVMAAMAAPPFAIARPIIIRSRARDALPRFENGLKSAAKSVYPSPIVIVTRSFRISSPAPYCERWPRPWGLVDNYAASAFFNSRTCARTSDSRTPFLSEM